MPMLLATRSARRTKPPSVRSARDVSAPHRGGRHQGSFMTTSLSSSRLTAALLETPSDTSRLATCPLCHTPHASLTHEALQAGGDWRCVRCGQQWDARRLDTVATYAAWVAEHESVERRGVSAARRSATPFPGTVRKNDPKELTDAVSAWDDEGGGPSSLCEKASAECDPSDVDPALYGPAAIQ
jgi:hypothetical protein